MTRTLFAFCGGVFTSLIFLGIFVYLYAKYKKSKEKLMIRKEKSRYMLTVYMSKNSYKSYTNLTEKKIIKKLSHYNPNTFVLIVDSTGKTDSTSVLDFVSYLRNKAKRTKKRESSKKSKLKELKKEEKSA